MEENQPEDTAEMQARLQKMGVCVQGFVWIRQSGGWRCHGGGHFISDAQLARAS